MYTRKYTYTKYCIRFTKINGVYKEFLNIFVNHSIYGLPLYGMVFLNYG